MVFTGIDLISHRGLYDDVVWIFNENNSDNTPISSVIAEQCLDSQGFLCFSYWSAVRKLGVQEKLGGDKARSADPNWP